jgi:carbon-monoxide dehydrogenase large subunit
MSIGQPVLRVEDARFLTGHGRFVDDIRLPATAYACVLRSPHAHARIRGIDKSAALAAPGVLLVLTGEDVAREGLGGLPCKFFPHHTVGPVGPRPVHSILAIDTVRHVGDRVALVVAETREQAKDAAELFEVDYEPLELDRSVCFQLENGDRAAVDAAFAAAAHVARLEMHYPRACANPIEPRACIGTFERYERRYTLYSTTQAPFRPRDVITADVLHIPEKDLRVVAPDIGGAFGMKGAVYPEEALVVWAAGKLDRPVKWTGERSESLLSDMHGRDMVAHGELALATDARLLALRVEITTNLGAYLSFAAGAPAIAAGTNLTSVYHLPLVHSMVRAVFSNTAPLGPYRGAGRPEAMHLLERLLDKAAREMGIDPVALRRRNLVPSTAMPYRTPGGHVYDSGDFALMLERTLEIAGWKDFARRRAGSERRGRRRGIGIAMHCEFSGLQSERMEIRVDQNGSIMVYVGTQSSGQGHETMYAQMVSDWLGVPLGHVRVFQGDTDRVLFGRGTYAERSTIVGGSALRAAADEVIKKGKRLAAWMLEAHEADIQFAQSEFSVAGTDRKKSFKAVAQQAYAGFGLPAEMGVGLEGVGSFAGPSSYPNGCMVAEVEVDPDTGRIRLESMAAVDDAGVVINPLMLEGQLHGSIAQGLGQALMEDARYDPETGQLLSGSFLDYAMPRADDMPAMKADVGLVPALTNPLGVKGGSEAGNMAAPPAIVNAIVDALAPLGVLDMAMPATSERVWRAINSTRRTE